MSELSFAKSSARRVWPIMHIIAMTKSWEQMALYTLQQGIAHRLMTPEELFPKGIMTKVII